MFNLLWRNIRTSIINGTITAEDIYWLFYSRVWMATGIIFTLSLGVDYYGVNGLQLIFLPIWLFAIGYIGLPILSLPSLNDAMKEAVCRLRRFVLHLALFGSIFFVTRFLVPVREYPFTSMMLLAGMIIIGLVAWLWPAKDPKAYRRYALVIAIIVIAIGVFGAFTGNKPAHGENPMAPIHNGVEGVVSNLFYSKTLELEVSSRQPQKLCGIKPGTRKFSIPEGRKIEIMINGARRDITSTVRVGKAFPGESFEAERDGCAEVTFAVNEDAKDITFPRQIIAIRVS